MERLTKRLDRNLAALVAREPYFAPSFQAARVLLDGAVVGNGGLIWPRGVVCGPEGCTCGNAACLHRPAWRVYVGK